MFQHESFFFVGVFVFIFLVWLVTGGPTHPLSFAGPLLAGPGPLGGGTYLSLPHAKGIEGGGATVDESHATGANLTDRAKELANERAFGVPSSYKGSVRLTHYISNAGSQSAQNEYLELYYPGDAGQSLTLTGWKLESLSSGNAAVIPQATEVPTAGIINAIQPVILRPGDRATIISGRSPIGASFRENTCTGYFAQYQTFYPSLSLSCPDAKGDLTRFYGSDLVRDQVCSSYVDRLYRCQAVLTPPLGMSTACQNFLTTYLNYNGCVLAHQNDSDFKSDTWRVYLGNDKSLWGASHDTIRLVDSNGKTVDLFSY